MRILNNIIQSLKQRKQRETLNYLRNMTDRQLIDCGFSPELVADGLKGWPWRIDSTTTEPPILEHLIKEEQRHVTELQNYSDSELADLALSRGTIRDSVRHGRPGIERAQTDEAA